MGIVVREICSNCKQDVYMPVSCTQMRCPHCKKADIINSRRKNRKNLPSEERDKKRYVFQSYDTKVTTCPKCGTNFTSSLSLKKGKIFCPTCHNPLSPGGND